MSALSRADAMAAWWVALRLRRLWVLLALGLLLHVQPGFSPAAHAQPGSAATEKRIALVIGNSRYPKFPLSNPENDARLIAGKLRTLGFEVGEHYNLNVLQFRRALRDFARKVQQDDATAVLYYAGHGVQIDGRNYLLPVDINLRDQEEVKDESVDIDELFLSRIDKVGSFPRIVILDACRNNPFAGKTRNIRSAGGLAEMGARGTLIAFASAPGAPAEDGPDGGNSIYTKSLAEELTVPGIEVEQMFKNVRVKVLRDTQGRQLPWVNTSLTSDFSFSPGRAGRLAAAQQAARPAPAAAAPLPPKDIETALERARRERDSLPSAVPAPAAPAAQPPAVAPPVAVAAIPPSVPALPAAAVPSSQSPAARQHLGRDELQQLLIGKSHSFEDGSPNDVMRWDLRSSGLIYYNSQSVGRAGVNGAGRWELKDDGSLCVRFNAAPPLNPGQARRPDSGCWQFFREGEKLMRVGAASSPQSQQQQPQVQILNLR